MQTTKGAISILLTLLILSSLLVIGLGVATLMIRELKMATRVEDSTRAYQVADSGLERALVVLKKDPKGGGLSECDSYYPVDSGSYCLQLTKDADGNVTEVKSIGRAGKTRRAVEVAVAAPAYVEKIETVCFTAPVSPPGTPALKKTLLEVCQDAGYSGATGFYVQADSSSDCKPSPLLEVHRLRLPTAEVSAWNVPTAGLRKSAIVQCYR